MASSSPKETSDHPSDDRASPVDRLIQLGKAENEILRKENRRLHAENTKLKEDVMRALKRLRTQRVRLEGEIIALKAQLRK